MQALSSSAAYLPHSHSISPQRFFLPIQAPFHRLLQDKTPRNPAMHLKHSI